MKNFTPYLLIGIILTFVSFVVFGIFSDNTITLEANTRIQNVSTIQVKSILNNINDTKQWSLLFKNEDIEFELDESEKEIDWRKIGKENWITLKITEEGENIVYSIKADEQDDTKMFFVVNQDNNDIELECKYTIGIPLVFRFFKSSMKERLTKDLNENLSSLKQFIESK